MGQRVWRGRINEGISILLTISRPKPDLELILLTIRTPKA